MACIFITGSLDGLGRAAASALMSDGHQVVLHGRSHQRVKEALAFTRRAAGVVVGDLADATQVGDLADQVNRIGQMDAVIHNAGIYIVPERGSTSEGHSTVLAVNTLAPYLLTALIDRPKRLIYLSSGLHRDGEGSLADLDWTRRRWNGASAYAETKLHVAALAAVLPRLWPGILSNAVDPGWVRTRMGGPSAPVDLATGQRTQSWLATSEEPAAKVAGGYWHHMRPEEPASEVRDPGFQDALLEQLKTLTGVGIESARVD
jgi:NAD(P)-dependent dehydrogenase (short-subunit alcohol dehydrogenase family)